MSTNPVDRPRRFPAPVQLSPRATRWRLSDLIEYESGQPAAGGDAEERFLRVREVAKRYDVCDATVWRWAADASKGAA